jgi:hypothetical protein
MPPLDTTDGRSGASTPRTRNRNNARKRGESRKQQPPQSPGTPTASDPDTPDVDSDDESEELFQLLGVGVNDDGNGAVVTAPVVEKGLLRLSKENMDAALGNNSSKKKRVRTKNKPRNDRAANLSADHEDNADSTARQNNGASPTPNGNSRRRPAKDNVNKNQDTSSSRDPSPTGLRDLTAMSRSLPASFFAEDKKENGKGDSKVWDMPIDTSPGSAQGLTWQQQLQAEETSTPSKRSTRSSAGSSGGRRTAKAATPAVPSPSATRHHDRRQSLDQVPVSNLTKMMASVGPASAGGRGGAPVSAFDASIPYHTGFNVHRAPQTPVRNVTAARVSPVAATLSSTINLPIVGDFPRINKSGGPLGGPKYAGPTFHNSPASGSLPKPDLDDF